MFENYKLTKYEFFDPYFLGKHRFVFYHIFLKFLAFFLISLSIIDSAFDGSSVKQGNNLVCLKDFVLARCDYIRRKNLKKLLK